MKPWERYIRRVTPYTPGEQPNIQNIIKLNTNENPYPPAPGAARAAREFDTDGLRLYPDPGAGALTEALARYYGLEKEQVFVGVGSDDVLAMCFMTFFNAEKPILFPDITYSFYSVWADLYRIPYVRPALNQDFCMVASDYYGENGGVIFPNPNAPTAVYESLETVEDIVAHNQDVVVIIDEAYVDFAGASARSLLDKYENLLVVQTFSKSRSMAGLRIGFAMGSPALIRALNDVKFSFNSYTMNRASLVVGAEAVKDKAYFEENVRKIIATREAAKVRLRALGFSFPNARANFIFARHESRRAEEIFKALKEKGIYVRYFDSPRIDNHLRITVGTDEEMEALYKALEEILQRP